MNGTVESRTKNIDEKFCSECASVINIKAEICPKCGVRQMPSEYPRSSTALNGRSKVVAALFAIFLGWMGAHKFYLGQIVWGLLYLLFFWTTIPAIIAFFEFILLLAMSDEKFNRKYGS
jgi:TM2 domain-containing membrane protein YozV/ribosomal protein L40E